MYSGLVIQYGKLGERLKSLLVKSNEIEEKRKLFTSMKNRSDFISAEHLTDRIVLNIGGKCINIDRKSVIAHSSDNLLLTLLSGKYDHLLPKDKSGIVFLDLDSRWVEPQFNLLRDLNMWDGNIDRQPHLASVCPLNHAGMQAVSNYFSVNDLLAKTVPVYSTDFQESDILSPYPESANSLSVLFEDRNIQMHLLYRSSRDGFDTSTFHQKCSGFNETLCIIKDKEGNVFGGYSDVKWTGSSRWQSSSNAFLCSFVKNGKFSVVKHSLMFNCDERAMFDTPAFVCFGQHDLFVDSNCNIVKQSQSYRRCGCSYDVAAEKWNSIFNQTTTCFVVAEIELLAVLDCNKLQRKTSTESTHTVKSNVVNSSTESDIDLNKPTVFGDCEEFAKQVAMFEQQLNEKESTLMNEITSHRDELKFVAQYIGIALSVHGGEMLSGVSAFQNILNEIETISNVLFDDRAKSGSLVTDGSIVCINACGTVLAVSKATLLQAPSGSILANMASDVWGHDLDSEGNIIQDVNPELFTAIINYLRLKALLPASEVPPITVYEEQCVALENLLSFYMLTDIPIAVLNAAQQPSLKRKYTVNV